MINNQSGFSLIMGLIILAIMALLGVSIMSSGVSSQKIAVVNQEDTMVFHAAQTANSSYVSTYYYDASHLVETAEDAYWDTLPAPKNGYVQCTNEFGDLVECDSDVRLESDKILKARVEAFYHDCETAALKCLGNSWDNTGLGCHSFQLIGEGNLDVNKNDVADVGEANTHIEEWVSAVRSCNKAL